MPYSRISGKGQITLPKVVREVLGVERGDRVAFRIGDDGIVTVEPETIDLLSLRGRLAPRRKGVSLDDMEDAIRNAGQES
ncbi:MAG TPA: AbrB/MazE/SpoVT family DNA-binding domain-containing protein [Longimicrobiaceae bacterium]|nr:AbrB/MazE/SpoVT family DNA-binding domain-containing protein [Longimicrobiaceae bacterium]